MLQQLDEWGGHIQLWDSDPMHREFVLSVVDRGNTLWYKLALHGDNSCIINEVYYSELDQGLSAVATRHGIQRAEAGEVSPLQLRTDLMCCVDSVQRGQEETEVLAQDMAPS